MIAKKIKGAMVNILSMSGHGGQPFIIAYCGSKGALATLTKNAAFSLMRNNIRINGLNIGWMDTPGEDRIQKLYHDAPGRLAEEGGGGGAVRAAPEADGGGARGRLSRERRVRPDDRLDHRLRPAGARLGRELGAAVEGDGALEDRKEKARRWRALIVRAASRSALVQRELRDVRRSGRPAPPCR